MLTVLIASHNGAGTLGAVLGAYARIEAPSGGFKIVIVDNASTDSTSDLVKGFHNRLDITLLRIEGRGKNKALNAGLPLCKGDLVVFSDDDAVPEYNTITNLRRAADENSQFDIFGGTIRPIWPTDCPDWIERVVNLGAVYGVTPTYLRTGPVGVDRIWGALMAVRSRVLQTGLRFNEGIGPAAGQYMMGSESDFNARAESAGHKAWFVAEATVGHIIRPHQLTRNWIIQRGYRLGRGMFPYDRKTFTPDMPIVFGAPRWKYRELFEHYVAWIRSTLSRNFDETFRAAWNISILHGYLAEARRQSGSRH